MDPTLAVVGLILLLIAITLGGILPKVETVPNQFRVSFVPVETVLTGFTLDAPAQTDLNQAFDITIDNVYQILLVANVADDIPSSDPDVFVLKVKDPLGNTRGEGFELETRLSEPAPDSGPVPTSYVSPPRIETLLTVLNAKPEDTIFQTDDLTLTAEAVRAMFVEENRQATIGPWAVFIRLGSPGNCPPVYAPPTPSGIPSVDPPPTIPLPSSDQANRAAVCQQVTSAAAAAAQDPALQGNDPSNPITIESLTLVSFDVVAELLG